ncbi:MAG: TMEM175 family protein [Candidatus Bathyarchaeia archaeon]
MPELSPNQIPRARIQTLSDLVFGLALSIGALALINQQPHDLGQLSFSLFAFAFSFLILVNVWYRYSTIMSVLPVETAGLIVLNLFMLFLVSVEPYLLNLLVFQTSLYSAVGEYVSIFYGLDIAALNLVIGWFVHALANEEKRLVPREMLRHYRLVRNFMFTGAAVFVLSLFPFFSVWRIAGFPVRIIMWVATLPLGWVMRFARKPSKNSH